LRAAAPLLAPVRITAMLDAVGFAHRQQLRLGKYLTAADIEAQRLSDMEGVLHALPTVELRRGGPATGLTVTSTRRAPIKRIGNAFSGNICAALYFDAHEIVAEDLQMIPSSEIAAVESYRPEDTPTSLATEVPGYKGGCATVFVWSKEYQARALARKRRATMRESSPS
ncbi:MAG TPA: hypothetical protein VGT98_09695, partial [Candidatus Elarobacter sp.]|nr:hypothetical protein [Candidatus Elarobacter sp.]